MPPSKNLNAYAYHERVLETALAAGGAKLSLQTDKQAATWRRDANYFRQLLRNVSSDGRSKYDSLKIGLQGSIVVIERYSDVQIVGLTGLKGQAIDVVTPEPEVKLSLEERLRLAQEELDNDGG